MELNRKILMSLLTIGLIASAVGASTYAIFTDTENSPDNTFQAGALDLKIDWNESYNGEHVEEQPLTDNPGSIFELNDVKPGDEGEATISYHVFDNPAYISMQMDVQENDDNGNTEPELDVDQPDDPNNSFDGELLQNLNITLWYDDGDNVLEEGEDRINTNQTVSPEQVCRPVGSLDVSLVMDRSGSMFGEPLETAKNSSKDLVDQLNQSAQSALVSFASGATLDQQLTTNKTAVKQAIDQLSSGGGTNIPDGVSTAQQELLNGANARSNATKVMVVLSDGVSSGDPVTAAQTAKDQGIRVITIALGGADEEVMRQMASSDDDAYTAANASALDQVFADISQGIVCEPVEEEETDLQQGILLDADRDEPGIQAFENSTTHYIGFKWEIPLETGNEIQTDRLEFDLNFNAVQRRHNDNPEIPFQ